MEKHEKAETAYNQGSKTGRQNMAYERIWQHAFREYGVYQFRQQRENENPV